MLRHYLAINSLFSNDPFPVIAIAFQDGSVIAMSSDTGAVTEGPYTYDSFGNSAPATGVPYKYTGHASIRRPGSITTAHATIRRPWDASCKPIPSDTQYSGEYR